MPDHISDLAPVRRVGRMILICKSCKKPFETVRRSRQYCSQKCYTATRGGKSAFVCKQCGKGFYRYNSYVSLRGEPKFCSRKCRTDSLKKEILKTCPVCNKTFHTKPALIARGGGNTCSRACFYKYHSMTYRGPTSHMWRGGISYEPYCEKFSDEFKERVREFWNRHCVECGIPEEESGKRHSVHHVNFNKKACCDDSKPLFVILCHSCHSETNFNRDYWRERFTRLIEDWNGGCSYFDRTGAPA
jgi:hypothetical protein